MKYRVLYQVIASTIQARKNCQKSGNTEWFNVHSSTLDTIEKNYLPHGSGLDRGTKILIDECKPNKLVLFAEFHHMNENGFYDGWTKHKIIITPSLTSDIDITISGRNRNDIKDYLAEEYSSFMYSEDFSIDSIYDILFERSKAIIGFDAHLFKIKSRWIGSYKMVIECNGKTFADWQKAKLYAIEIMEIELSKPKV